MCQNINYMNLATQIQNESQFSPNYNIHGINKIKWCCWNIEICLVIFLLLLLIITGISAGYDSIERFEIKVPDLYDLNIELKFGALQVTDIITIDYISNDNYIHYHDDSVKYSQLCNGKYSHEIYNDLSFPILLDRNCLCDMEPLGNVYLVCLWITFIITFFLIPLLLFKFKNITLDEKLNTTIIVISTGLLLSVSRIVGFTADYDNSIDTFHESIVNEFKNNSDVDVTDVHLDISGLLDITSCVGYLILIISVSITMYQNKMCSIKK